MAGVSYPYFQIVRPIDGMFLTPTVDYTAPRTPSLPIINFYTLLTSFSAGGHRPGGPRVLAGLVRQPDASPAVGYTVRLYSQATGQLLAETTSGASGEFEFDQMDSELYYVIAVDQLAETWKAPIVDLVTPALP